MFWVPANLREWSEQDRHVESKCIEFIKSMRDIMRNDGNVSDLVRGFVEDCFKEMTLKLRPTGRMIRN